MDALNPSTRLPCSFRLWLLPFVVTFSAMSGFAQAPVIASQRMGGGDRSVIRQIAPNPQELAAHFERTGRTHEAAALYEDLARTNSCARKILSPRLVTIYTETGETNKALIWAREVMRENPDPQAYLAAVQARLGRWPEARKILEHEIAGNTNAARAVTLRWQLAEVLEMAGNKNNAQKILDEAGAVAKGTAMEFTARRRLDAAGKSTGRIKDGNQQTNAR